MEDWDDLPYFFRNKDILPQVHQNFVSFVKAKYEQSATITWPLREKYNHETHDFLGQQCTNLYFLPIRLSVPID